ncbi:DNA replication complex GINS protein SLD5 [Colletotrichum spinosum]|uniref:DNA replication complex GINS protein SLD5 n=1 Tax=Colletotrichum spinosum TaxID=1347390 RepID=A0A4R8Q4Q6_9PEZI|nr:DNA replication complex GINS protein SLD5 [Colletotrichum spinosum]
MDIDDILREVDPVSHSIPSETRDLQALTRAWVAERSAPELLEWPANGLFERVNDRIKRQIEKVEDMTGDMDPKTNFALIVIQTELERFKFVVRSYLRARIAKVYITSHSFALNQTAKLVLVAQIDKHALHYLSSPTLRARLSETELAYATRHQALLHNHYLSSFLSSFPPVLQNLNDTAGNISMIDSPDLDTAVFIRLLRDTEIEGLGTDEDVILPGNAGDIFILRWSSAKRFVDDGDAELV